MSGNGFNPEMHWTLHLSTSGSKMICPRISVFLCRFWLKIEYYILVYTRIMHVENIFHFFNIL